jgi:hypothetical protein
MLQQLLPALGPHLQFVNKRQLARVVYALGSCHDSTWELHEEEEEQEEGEEEEGDPDQQQQQQQEGQRRQQQSREPGSRADSSAAVAAQTVSNSSSSLAPQLPSSSAAAAAKDSAGWVRRLLPLLPPSSLSTGALLAVWQGCALHEVSPGPTWLQQASWVVTGHLRSGKLDFNDTAGLLQVRRGWHADIDTAGLLQAKGRGWC